MTIIVKDTSEELFDYILALKAMAVLANPDRKLYSDFEVRGKTTLQEPVVDENDGWG